MGEYTIGSYSETSTEAMPDIMNKPFWCSSVAGILTECQLSF